MKIAVAGGRNKADFLIGALLERKHQLSVINDEETYCSYLAEKHGIPVVFGDPCKEYVLKDAHILSYDVMIALRPNDADNLTICQTAKRVFGIKRAVCIVSDPKNVPIFQLLGVDHVISATYMIANMIEQSSTVESLTKLMLLEDGNIALNELRISEADKAAGRKIAEIEFPANSIIACVIRNGSMFVPNGQSVLMPQDKLIMLTDRASQGKAVQAVCGNR